MIKINTPFYVPFFEKDCEFFENIKDDIISIIMEIHNKDPFAIQGSFPKGKLLKHIRTEMKREKPFSRLCDLNQRNSAKGVLMVKEDGIGILMEQEESHTVCQRLLAATARYISAKEKKMSTVYVTMG